MLLQACLAKIIDLDYDNFLGTVVEINESGEVEMIGDKPWFIFTYMPTCSHCLAVTPTWENFDELYHDEVNMGRVDRTSEKGGKLHDMLGVTGCPDFRFLPAKGQKAYEYD